MTSPLVRRGLSYPRTLPPGSQLEVLLLNRIRIAKLPEPEREFAFAKSEGRRFRFDFAYPEALVALEVEGGIWNNGAHVRGAHFTQDCEKYNLAACLGWRIVRVTRQMIESGAAVATVRRALDYKQEVPA